MIRPASFIPGHCILCSDKDCVSTCQYHVSDEDKTEFMEDIGYRSIGVALCPGNCSLAFQVFGKKQEGK